MEAATRAIPPVGAASSGTRTAEPRKLVFKSPAAARITLKDLMEALASPNAVERNSAINNALASSAIWHAHGITIRGAARIKHFLTALGILNLSSAPLYLTPSPSVIEWDALSTTARIHTVRRVRPIVFPWTEFAIPVDTELVFNVDSEPSTASRTRRMGDTTLASGYLTETQAAEAPSLYITKWSEEWPIDDVLNNVPWPFSIYISIFRTLMLPILIYVLIACAETLHNTQERIRHVQQTARRTVSRVTELGASASRAVEHQLQTNFPTLYHYVPHHLPTVADITHMLISLPLTVLRGPAQVFESSVQHTTGALNTFLPTSAQLPSPRVIEWYEAQHARAVQRKHEIHATRTRAASQSQDETQPQTRAQPPSPTQAGRAQAESSGAAKQRASSGAGHASGPQMIQIPSSAHTSLYAHGTSPFGGGATVVRRARTRSASTGSPQSATPVLYGGPGPASSWNDWPSRPPLPVRASPTSSPSAASAAFHPSMSASSSAEHVLAGSPTATIPAHRARDTSAMLATEEAAQPEMKRARHGEDYGDTATSGWMQSGEREDVDTAHKHAMGDAGMADQPLGSVASSIRSSMAETSQKGSIAAGSGGSGSGNGVGGGGGKGKKTVTFTPSGIIPASASASGAGPRISPATKTTFTGTGPEGAVAAAAQLKYDTGALGIATDLGVMEPPSASIAAEQLGASLVGEEASPFAVTGDQGHSRSAETSIQQEQQQPQQALTTPERSPSSLSRTQVGSPSFDTGKETHIVHGDPSAELLSTTGSYGTASSSAVPEDTLEGGEEEEDEHGDEGGEGTQPGSGSEPPAAGPRRRHHLFGRRSGSSSSSGHDLGTGIRQKISGLRSKAKRSLLKGGGDVHDHSHGHGRDHGTP
ncbi:hypothetical protein OC842_004831 [Tilletia horrida]|uniref:Uncharacterized protein n=1 Tax=Tilletia horrida TaxID=155126 RepID=A0AAN6JPX1_9BASI|nr:hypothetical protein OC842_004831 [Tilletia horrida]